jgi:hypothetical protein
MKWAGLLGVSVLGTLPLLEACRCGSHEGVEDTAPDTTLPLLDAESVEDEPEPASERCAVNPSARFSIAGASDDELEFDVASPTERGFALGGIRHRGAGLPFVIWVEGTEKRELELPEVHGPAAPPEVIAQGGSFLALLEESDARGTFLQLYRIAPGADAKLEKGPSLALDNRPFESSTLAASGSTVLAVWDTHRGATNTAIFAEVLDGATLKPTGTSVRLTPPSIDADLPRVLSRPGGYYVFWSRYGKLGSGSLGLEESLPSQLFVATLDEGGKLHGQPLALTPELSDLEFDARLQGDQLWVLLRRGPEGTIELIKVAASGTLEVQPVVAPALGPEPVLLASSGSKLVLLGESERGAPLLALGTGPDGLELTPEPLLRGREVLGSSPDGLVTWVESELGATLEVITCDSARKPALPSAGNASGGGG